MQHYIIRDVINKLSMAQKKGVYVAIVKLSRDNGDPISILVRRHACNRVKNRLIEITLMNNIIERQVTTERPKYDDGVEN